MVLRHYRSLMHLSLLVVGDPGADLFAVFEVAGAHFGTVFTEPLPGAVHGFAYHAAFCPDRAVFVVFDVLGDVGFHANL